jgi:hypothetical protein
MKERRKIFSAADLAAIKDGRKTMFREMVVPQPPADIDRLHGGKLRSRAPYVLRDDNDNPCGFGFQDDQGNYWTPPLGTIGDRLWLPEAWAPNTGDVRTGRAYYKAEGRVIVPRWNPSITMPRWASRITLEITGVRVERLNDISEEDAKAEGVESVKYGNETFWKAYGFNPLPEGGELVATRDARRSFGCLWQSRHGNWEANPWVWAYSIKLIKP